MRLPAALLAYEASASVIRQYDPVLVPGLLQTEEYGRALFEGVGRLGPEDVDNAWAVRQHRQEVLDRESPPEMLYVVDEAALQRQVGGARVMRHQLERIKEFTAESHVSIQIIPFLRGAHPGMAGNFVLLEFADPSMDDLVHLESINEVTVRDDTELIARYLDRFVQLEELALTPEESSDFLDELIKQMSRNSTNSTAKEAV